MYLECRSPTYRPFGLSGRFLPRLGGLVSDIPFFSTVPANVPGLVVSQILRGFCKGVDAFQTLRSKGDPLWV